ncbi:hypothetical protein PPMP20_04565 [Paraburkholderia phymatum]|uniref:hypothetical protein n=1 Tax=Paraburkholderia phymatum TaxID=148447 RepID=UPI0005A2BD50|nr:hypothetical protein [Paraburkholderia phymatum]
MKLSQYIAQLQSILETEGDLQVVVSASKALACAQGFTFGEPPDATVARVGDYYGMKLVLTGDGNGVNEFARVVYIGGREPLAQTPLHSYTASWGKTCSYSP